MSEQKQHSEIDPSAWKVGGQLFAQKHIADIHARGVSKPVEPLYTRTDPNVRWEAVAGEQMKVIERLRAELGEARGEYDRSANKLLVMRAQLTERDVLLRDFCAHSALICGDLLRLARDDDFATTDPIRTRAYSAMDHARKVKKTLSASAEPSTPSLMECDACPRSSGCVGSCMKVSP